MPDGAPGFPSLKPEHYLYYPYTTSENTAHTEEDIACSWALGLHSKVAGPVIMRTWLERPTVLISEERHGPDAAISCTSNIERRVYDG
jgi:hypothetical protein